MPRKHALSQYHCGVAAEAFAAGLLARCGCDVLVQYGANQPEYDLVAKRAQQALWISVKGSQDGGWGLTQSFKKPGVSYAEAAKAWAAKHDPRIIMCFVQFKDVAIDACPEVYLAPIGDVAKQMVKARNGLGDTTIQTFHTWATGQCAGWTDAIPSSWSFSAKRLDQMFEWAAA